MFCFSIIICLGMRLPANSSDFSEVGGHLYNLRFNLAFGRGLPSRYLPISLVKLLTHRCTIACDINIHRQSVILCYDSNYWQLAKAWFCSLGRAGFAFAHTAHLPKFDISVVLSTGSHRPEFLRRPVLECTDFPHIAARLSGCFI